MLAGGTLKGFVAKGYLDGGILSPLLWSLAEDELIRRLNENSCYTLEYVGNKANLISRKFPKTISELLQKALNMVQQCCDRTQLSTDPQMILTGLDEPTCSEHTLQLTTEVKYLGLTLDKGCKSKAQLKGMKNKACRAFWTCKDTFGTIWSVKPRAVH
jgi:hypothetical protein